MIKELPSTARSRDGEQGWGAATPLHLGSPTLNLVCGPYPQYPTIDKSLVLTAHAQPVTGAGGFHFLRHRVVSSTLVHALILLAGIDDLEIP